MGLPIPGHARAVWLGMVLTAAMWVARAAVAQNAPTQSGNINATIGAVQLEEVVVTATKRAETVKETPTAITAITGAKLDMLGVQEFTDYLPYVPSLQVNASGFASGGGAPGTGVIIIRGIYSGFAQATPTAAFYIDETPFSPNGSSNFFGVLALPDPDLSDVERVEVLKGPQSTLFGASTLGGVIRVITQKPNLTELSGSARVDGVAVNGGATGVGLRGSVNLPIVADKLALRLSGFDRLDPGYVDNVRTKQTDVNSTRVRGGRLTLRYAPIDPLDIELSALYQRTTADGTAQEDVNASTLQPLEGNYEYSSFFNAKIDTRIAVTNLTATYHLDAGTITNATSYGHYTSNQHSDFSSSFGGLPFFIGVPDAAALGFFIPTLNKFSEELRFNSNRIGPLEFQGGVYYTHESSVYIPIVDSVNGLTGAALFPPPLTLFNNLLTGNTSATYKEYAGFGDVTWHFGQNWDATAGLRQSHNDQKGASRGVGPLAGPTLSFDFPSRSSDNDTSYLLTVRWRPTSDLSTYARFASAYRPGGPQFVPATTSFKPDTVWNYELGAKGVWLDGRLSTDADIFYIRWRDIQLNSLVDNLLSTGNGGDAHSEGVEFQAQFRPITQFLLGINAAYDQTRIDSTRSTSTAGDRVGDSLPNTPRWSGAFTTDYTFPLPVSNASGNLGASYQYQGRRTTSFSDDPLNTNVTLPAYSVVNLRAGLNWSHYGATFRVDNVANKYALANNITFRLFPGQPVPGVGIPIEPRTYRLSLEARF